MSDSSIWIPNGEGHSEFSEKKSRFIGLLTPAETPESVKETVKRLKAEHPQARHVVHAYILEDDGSKFGFSDDGEPHGTAGRPVFDVLKGSGMVWAGLYIIRYFGGIKLGTGGLVSAYSHCASETVKATLRQERIPEKDFSLTLTYPQHQRIRELLPSLKGVLLSEIFTEEVHLTIRLPIVQEQVFRDYVQELGRGSLNIETR